MELQIIGMTLFGLIFIALTASVGIAFNKYVIIPWQRDLNKWGARQRKRRKELNERIKKLEENQNNLEEHIEAEYKNKIKKVMLNDNNT